jgi:predicted alpha/beta-hydrolase family hydrolase
MVLTHGAGSDCAAPLLGIVADAFCLPGLTVLRCDLPFRQQRPKSPPSPATLTADRQGLKTAVTALRGELSAARSRRPAVPMGAKQSIVVEGKGHDLGGRRFDTTMAAAIFMQGGLVWTENVRFADNHGGHVEPVRMLTRLSPCEYDFYGAL